MARYIVQHRRGSVAQWAEQTTLIPLEGEIVIEIDEVNSLHKLKIGDGKHTYSELAYLRAGDEIVTQVLAEARPRIVTVELTLDWNKDADGKYSQVLILDNITKRSRLDLQPTADMLAEFKQSGFVFVTENKGGTITVYAVGNMPLKEYTMQATIVETEYDDEDMPVVGAPTVTPLVQSDWNQTDETKADYIKNKPINVSGRLEFVEKSVNEINKYCIEETPAEWAELETTVINGKRVRSDTLVEVENPNYAMLSFTPTSGTTYKFYGRSLSSFKIHCAVIVLDASGVVIDRLGADKQAFFGYDIANNICEPAIEYTAPENAAEIIVNGVTYPVALPKVEHLHQEPATNKLAQIDTFVNNPLYGKKLGLVGDSICYGNGYVGGYGKFIADKNNMTLNNLGIGSTCLATDRGNTSWRDEFGNSYTLDMANLDWENNTYGTRYWDNYYKNNMFTWITEDQWDGKIQLYRRAESISERIARLDSDCDYVLAEGVVNDYLNGIILGEMTETMTDELDTKTLYGAMELLCRNLLTYFPNKKTGFILVHKVKDYYRTQREAWDGTLKPTMDEYVKAVKEVCAKYSIPVCDLYDGGRFPTELEYFSQEYTMNGDGTHPNEKGYRFFYADEIEAFMKSLASGTPNVIHKRAITEDKLAPSSVNGEAIQEGVIENRHLGTTVLDALNKNLDAAYVNKNLANALIGSDSGEAIRIDDISPLEHEVDCVVKSKNIIPYPYVNTTMTNNGITFTDNRDGSITINGTATDTAYFTLRKNDFYLPVGSTMTIGAITETDVGVKMVLQDDAAITTLASVTNVAKTITTNYENHKLYIMIYKDKTIENLTIYPQIELGTVATEWTPYISDLSVVKVNQYDKNLFPWSSYTLNKGNAWGQIIVSMNLPKGKYVFSGNWNQKGTLTKIAYVVRDENETVLGTWVQSKEDKTGSFTYPFEVNDPSLQVRVTLWSNFTGSVVDNCICDFTNVQLEVGTEKTELEEPITPVELSVNEDGTINGVNSISPSMTLTIDTSGALLDVKYSRDINKAFAELQQAIISLGGNV